MRAQRWKMSPGESVVFAASLERDLDAGETLASAEASVWRQAGATTWTQDATFTLAAQVNASAYTPDGSTVEVPVGKAVVVRITAPSDSRGQYEVRLEGPTSASGHAVRPVGLTIVGPPPVPEP